MPRKYDFLFTLTNPCGCSIGVRRGTLASPTGIDFITMFHDPRISEHWRTPKHEHVAVDIIARGFAYSGALDDLIEYFHEVLRTLKPLSVYPTREQVGKINPSLRQTLIDKLPLKYLFHTQDLLTIYELIMWQEVTRYPNGKLSREILDCLDKRDLFSAVNLATRKLA